MEAVELIKARGGGVVFFSEVNVADFFDNFNWFIDCAGFVDGAIRLIGNGDVTLVGGAKTLFRRGCGGRC